MTGGVIEYLKQSMQPGGSPKRMKEWMGVMLLLQTLATVMPGKNLHNLTVIDSVLLTATTIFVIFNLLFTSESAQVKLIWTTYIVGIIVFLVGGLHYHSHRADLLIAISWSIALYINERRLYINLSQYIVGMVAGLLGLSICIYYSMIMPPMPSVNAAPLIICGCFFIACNSYILITDFRHGLHQMDYFERQFDSLNELSSSLSKILSEDKPIKDIMWDVTQLCIPLLGLEDFVIYLYNDRKNALVQVAAYGEKKTSGKEIINPIEIRSGQGVVGKVFIDKKPMLISDTTNFDAYVVDDQVRMSELATPILISDRVLGVIDSEHSQKNFFTHKHVQLFNVIAAFCSIKIAQDELRMQKVQAEKQRLEVIKLKELEQLKNKFVTNISHDLKTPLSLILAPANQIHDKADDPFVKEQALYIMKNTDHLMSMVEQLLQLNSIDQGINASQIDTIEVLPLLKNIHTQYQPLVSETGVEIDIQVNGNIVLSTDSYKLSQCIHNLLQNAFKHTPKGGHISVTAKRLNAKETQFIIADTGIGIHPENHEKVFERFFKIDVNNHKGTGIGLSLVKEYISQLKGTINLRSAPTEGTTFTIVLPDLAPQLDVAFNQQVEMEYNASSSDEKQPLILIAEDHAELNSFIAQSLQSEGYRCLQTYNGKDAQKMTEQYLPDLVITDLMMPELTGEELVDQVKNSDKTGHIPIIVLTAKNQTDNRIELYNSGADNYIPKPFKIDELIAIVENTIKQRKLIRDKFYNDYMPDVNVVSSEGDVLSPKTENEFINTCMSFVIAHLDDPDLNVALLGNEVGMGRNKLQKKIKKETGLTPVEFIRSIRLHEAYKLISNKKNYNISEVAYMTGFSNLPYFSRSFKTQFGIAPTEMVDKV